MRRESDAPAMLANVLTGAALFYGCVFLAAFDWWPV